MYLQVHEAKLLSEEAGHSLIPLEKKVYSKTIETMEEEDEIRAIKKWAALLLEEESKIRRVMLPFVLIEQLSMKKR